ncbi:MAG: bL28 family ribosomal protein [Candidatus Limnocylindria bacterium]
MARVCDVCGKRPITGWNPQSVGMNRKRALRRWLPNLQPMTLRVGDRMVTGQVCSSCRRTAEKVRR